MALWRLALPLSTAACAAARSGALAPFMTSWRSAWADLSLAFAADRSASSALIWALDGLLAVVLLFCASLSLLSFDSALLMPVWALITLAVALARSGAVGPFWRSSSFFWALSRLA